MTASSAAIAISTRRMPGIMNANNFWATSVAAARAQKARESGVQSAADMRLDPNGTPWWKDNAAGRPVTDVALPNPSNDPEVRRVAFLQQKLASTKGMGNCPSCSSANYSQVNAGDPRARFPVMRCFDCGYPVVQSTSGMTATTKGAPRAARQPSQMTVTDPSGRVLGKTDAASGYRGESRFFPTDTRAGKIE